MPIVTLQPKIFWVQKHRNRAASRVETGNSRYIECAACSCESMVIAPATQRSQARSAKILSLRDDSFQTRDDSEVMFKAAGDLQTAESVVYQAFINPKE